MKKPSDSSERDLRHFMSLAEAQLNHRLKEAEATQPYTDRINRMRLLQELLKEQMPVETASESRRDANTNTTAENSRSSTRAPR